MYLYFVQGQTRVFCVTTFQVHSTTSHTRKQLCHINGAEVNKRIFLSFSPVFFRQILYIHILYVFIFQVYDSAVTKWCDLETPYPTTYVGISASVDFFVYFQGHITHNIGAYSLFAFQQ
jgi:hypothetical protein